LRVQTEPQAPLRRFRRATAAAVATCALLLPVATAEAARTDAPPVAQVAHSCSSGYRHAVTPGGHKCLRAGQYCSTKPGYGSVYRSKGYVCRGGRLRYR
jgi:hypothetical protein